MSKEREPAHQKSPESPAYVVIGPAYVVFSSTALSIPFFCWFHSYPSYHYDNQHATLQLTGKLFHYQPALTHIQTNKYIGTSSQFKLINLITLNQNF